MARLLGGDDSVSPDEEECFCGSELRRAPNPGWWTGCEYAPPIAMPPGWWLVKWDGPLRRVRLPRRAPCMAVWTN